MLTLKCKIPSRRRSGSRLLMATMKAAAPTVVVILLMHASMIPMVNAATLLFLKSSGRKRWDCNWWKLLKWRRDWILGSLARPNAWMSKLSRRIYGQTWLPTAKRAVPRLSQVTCSLFAVALLIPSAYTHAGIMSKVPVASDAKFADVSVPYCFICLLHLCNEKSLKLVRGCSFAVSHVLVQFVICRRETPRSRSSRFHKTNSRGARLY